MARMLGGISGSESGKSVSRGAKYFVTDSEMDSFLPKINDPASWAGSGFLVTGISMQKELCGWTVSLTAGPADDGSFTTKSDDKHNLVMKSYSDSEFYFDPSFWGVRRADSKDEEDQLLNIKTAKCRKGDHLYRDATADSRGAPDTSLSPFTATTLPENLIGQRLKTCVFTCRFYSLMNINSFAEFSGVNGSFSAKCRPHVTTSGRWLAVKQNLNSEIDRNGKIWAVVDRSVMMAPETFSWSGPKNGGTWRW